MNRSDTQRSLEIYRYAILMVAFNTFIACLLSPVILTSNPNMQTNLSYDDTLIPALFATAATAFVGVVSYALYAHFTKSSSGKKHFHQG